MNDFIFSFRSFSDFLTLAKLHITGKCPNVLRPIIVILLYVFMIVLFIILIPVSIPIIIYSFFKGDAYKKLKIELDQINSIDEKIHKLKKVYVVLSDDHEKLAGMKTVIIKPYGKFMWHSYMKVIQALYIECLNADKLIEADEVCEKLIDKLLLKKAIIDIGTEIWIKKRAVVIYEMKGKEKTLEYISNYLKRTKPKGPLDQYNNYIMKK